MAFQDRYYDREQSDRRKPLMRLFSGSLPLFSNSSIRVRAHPCLLVFIGLVLLFGAVEGFTLQHRVVSMAILFAVLALHELAHFLTAIAVGSSADEVVLGPLGGLADAQAIHRPGPTLATVAAGPVMNLALAMLAAGLLHGLYQIELPTSPHASFLAPGDWTQPQFYLWYIYVVSYALLLFNLLPVYPLDGAHLLQTLLWPVVGYGKSLVATCNIGIASAALAGGYGVYSGHWLVVLVMLAGAAFCIQKRAQIKAAGVWSFDEYDVDVHKPRRRRLSRFTKWKARRQIRREDAELSHLDVILEKIQRQGIHALNWCERRVLRRATDRQREMDLS